MSEVTLYCIQEYPFTNINEGNWTEKILYSIEVMTDCWSDGGEQLDLYGLSGEQLILQLESFKKLAKNPFYAYKIASLTAKLYLNMHRQSGGKAFIYSAEKSLIKSLNIAESNPEVKWENISRLNLLSLYINETNIPELKFNIPRLFKEIDLSADQLSDHEKHSFYMLKAIYYIENGEFNTAKKYLYRSYALAKTDREKRGVLSLLPITTERTKSSIESKKENFLQLEQLDYESLWRQLLLLEYKEREALLAAARWGRVVEKTTPENKIPVVELVRYWSNFPYLPLEAEKSLKKFEGGNYELLAPKIITFEDITTALGHNEIFVLVGSTSTENRGNFTINNAQAILHKSPPEVQYYVIYLTNESWDFDWLGQKKAIDLKHHQFRKIIGENLEESIDYFAEYSKILRKIFLVNKSNLANVYILPSGTFSNLPLWSLLSGLSEQETTRFTILSSPRQLIDQQKDSSLLVNEDDISIYAEAKYSIRESENIGFWKNLSSSSRDACLKRNLPQAKLFTKEKFSISNFVKYSPRSEIIHLSTLAFQLLTSQYLEALAKKVLG